MKPDAKKIGDKTANIITRITLTLVSGGILDMNFLCQGFRKLSSDRQTDTRVVKLLFIQMLSATLSYMKYYW